MEYEQLAQEIRDLNDAVDRQQIAVEALDTKVQFLIDRHIPSTVADLEHTQNGMLKLVADQAGTLQSLATSLYSISDRLTLVEGLDDPNGHRFRPVVG